MILKLDIEVKRLSIEQANECDNDMLKLDIKTKKLSIEQANECDKDTLCFDFGRIIGDGTSEINNLLPLIYAGL